MAKRKFKITEEQYKMALKEGVTVTADVSAANGDVKKAVDTAKQEAINNGLNTNDTSIEVPANYNESRVYSIKELKENYRRKVKEQSPKFTVREFLDYLKKH